MTPHDPKDLANHHRRCEDRGNYIPNDPMVTSNEELTDEKKIPEQLNVKVDGPTQRAHPVGLVPDRLATG